MQNQTQNNSADKKSNWTSWILKIPNWVLLLIFVFEVVKVCVNFTGSNIEPGDKLYWISELVLIGIIFPIYIYFLKRKMIKKP